MATCRDCVHVEVCRYYTNELAKANGIPLKLEEVERLLECDDCENFKDRSRLVELPCKLGDFVYFIKARRVMADIVSKFTIDRCGVMLQRVNGYNLGYTDQLGKKIFLTHEEAEQALKEREGNG